MYTMTHVSLEINTDNLRVAVSRRNKIIKYGYKSFEKGLVKDGVILDQHAIGIVINTIFDLLKLPRNHIICTISGLPFLYRTITLPSSITDEYTITEALTRAARKEMQVEEDDFAITWQKTESHIDENDFFVIAIRRNAISALVKTLEIADIKADLVDLQPLCLARLVGQSDALVACIEHDYFEIVIIKDGLVRTIHTLSPHPEFKEKDELANEFTDGLLKALRSYNADFPNKPLASDISLFISGELSADNDLIYLIHESTEHSINIIQPQLKNPIDAPPSLYANCIGALLNKHPNLLIRDETLMYQDISIDVLDAFREKGAARRWPAYVAVAVGCLAMIAVSYYLYDLQSDKKLVADQLDIQIADMIQELGDNRLAYEEAKEKEAANNAILNTLQDQIQRSQEVTQAIIAQQNDFAGQLVFINSSLSRGINLDSLSIDDNNIIINGNASHPLWILEFTEALETDDKYPEAMIMAISPGSVSENITGEGVTFNINIPISDKTSSN